MKNEDELNENLDMFLKRHGLTGILCHVFFKEGGAVLSRGIDANEAAMGILSLQADFSRRITNHAKVSYVKQKDQDD